GEAHRQQGGGDEPGPDRRTCLSARSLLLAASSLQPRIVISHSRPQPARPARAHHLARRIAERDQPAIRLPVSYPLPIRHRTLPDPASTPYGRQRWARSGLPPHWRTAAVRARARLAYFALIAASDGGVPRPAGCAASRRG